MVDDVRACAGRQQLLLRMTTTTRSYYWMRKRSVMEAGSFQEYR